MKPAFALSLSFDGIALLHRAAGGWRFVGEVSLESDDLARDLAKLREKALRLVPEEMRCKVIIPNDQVRYLSVATGSFTGEARDRIVATTLDGATPYALADLAFDTSPDGEMTHIAAVARETLNEAEAFAEEHGFGPVSFVAIPGENDFLGEPFFGRASGLSRKERVEPDGVAVVVIGPALVPPETAAPAGEAPSFSSRRARHPAPSYDIDPDAEAPMPRINFSAPSEDAPVHDSQGETISDPAEDEPEAVEEAAPVESAPPRPAQTDGSVASDSPPLTTFVDLPGGGATDVTAPVLAVPDEPEEMPAEGFAAFLSRRSRPARSEAPKPNRPAEPAPALAAPRKLEIPLPQRQVPKDEAGRMTVFGARNNDPISGQGRRLGLILTGGLLVVLMVVALWASLFLDDGLAGLFRSGETRTEIAVRPAAVPAPSVQTEDPVMAAAPAETARMTASEPAPAEQEPQGPALSATDAAVLDALRDSSQPESSQPEAAEVPDQPPDPEMVPATEEAADVETAMLSEPVPPADEEALADGQPVEETDPSAAPEEEAAEAPPATPMTDAARYAATGIWPVAPNVPETPSIIGIDDLYIASIDRTDLSQDAIALMPLDTLDTDRVPGGQQSPAAAGTEFTLNSAGLVEPSRDGALNPDGVLIIQGPPPRRPPNPPVRAELAPQEQKAEQSRLASVRPRLRPADLPERVERSSLGGLTRAELATVRPKLRPASLVVPESAPAAVETPEESAVPASASASALAVSTSPRPDARPAGFASLVARAKPAPSVQDPGDDGEPETVAATVAPRIPTSASVARQATLKNAINLRQLNLIGVYGTPSNRRALIRLPSGRYKKVQVGDTVDGGRVVAIGDGELRYQKGGRNMTLKVPSG